MRRELLTKAGISKKTGCRAGFFYAQHYVIFLLFTPDLKVCAGNRIIIAYDLQKPTRSIVNRWRQIAFWRVLCLVILVMPAAPSDVWGIAQTPGEHSEYLEDALIRINKKDYEGALIQLKNALKLAPAHLPARILLGETYLRLDEGAAAEIEFRRALRMGADEDGVLVPLGNALLLQRKYEEVLKIIRSSHPASVGGPEILSIRGQAQYELGDLDAAEQSFTEAARLGPTRPEPLLGKAQVLMARQRIEDAETLVDQARVLAPDDSEVWFRKGELRRAAQDPQGALTAFDTAIEKNLSHMRAHLARSTLLLEMGDYERARTDAEFVRARSPNNPKAAFLLAQALVRLGENERAQEAFQSAVDRVSLLDEAALMKDPAALQLAALVSFARRDLEKANRLLGQLVSLRPYHAAARKLLGRVQLQLGDAESAIHTLHPLYKLMPNDTEVLALLGDAYLKKGRYVEASSIFEKAVELISDQPELQTRLAISKIGAGRTRDALQDLQRLVDLDAGTLRAGILLTLLQMKRGDYDEALKTARQLREKEPDNAAVHNLIGAVKLQMDDFAGARANLATALDLEPHFGPARYNLARVELHVGDFKAAARQYNAILEREPRQSAALIGLSDIALHEGRVPDAVDLLERASIDPDEVQPQIRLIDLYLKLGQRHDALRRALRLSDRHPERADVLTALARAQIAADKRDDAKLNYRRAVRFSSYSGRELMDIAMGQVGLRDYQGARWTLQKATETKMVDFANAALVRLDLLTGDLDSATARVQEIKKSRPNSILGDQLAGDVFMHEKRYAEAADAYLKGMVKEETFDLVSGLYNARRAMGDDAVALKLLEDWAQAHPDDLEARRTLALGYIESGRLDTARTRHEALLKDRPDDPVLLSNLARIYQLQKDPRARAYANKAVDAAPQWAVSLDTLGWILVTEGDSSIGLAYLRDALSRDSSPLIRFHVASALSELGRAEEARNELKVILEQEPKPVWIEDARELYNKLASQ